MPKLTLDVEMRDTKSTRTIMDRTDDRTDGRTYDRTYDAFTGDELRSPRTPNYIPTSPSFSKVVPFNPFQTLASPDATIYQTYTEDSLPPEPVKPLSWIWQCHLCKSRYPLSATRRCLLDGHFYCSGDTRRPNLKKKNPGQSCSSEFDYIGWRDWGEWRRKVLCNLENGVGALPGPKDCQSCEFPSQCRYAIGRPAPVSNAWDRKIFELPSTPPTSLNKTNKPRFYLADTVTLGPTLTFAAIEQDQQSLLTVAGSSKAGQKEAGTNPSPIKTIRSTSAIVEHIVKLVEKRTRKPVALSPIPEEFCSNSDSNSSPPDNVTPQSWDDMVGLELSKEGE